MAVAPFSAGAPRIRRAGGQTPQFGPTVLYEESPDELTIRPEDQVRATDGVVGSACGVVTDPRDPAQMTHLLVEVGHGRKRVAVPMSRISSMTTGVQVTMPTSQFWELPAFGNGGTAGDGATL